MPIRRAIAETLAPGSSASITTWALNSSDQRRRSCRGAPSRRSATASIIWKVLVPELGADIEAHIGSQTQQPIADCSPPAPDGVSLSLFAAYDALRMSTKVLKGLHATLAIKLAAWAPTTMANAPFVAAISHACRLSRLSQGNDRSTADPDQLCQSPVASPAPQGVQNPEPLTGTGRKFRGRSQGPHPSPMLFPVELC
ncbi:hypothetical protein ACVIM8_001655 [Bradyrhizobium sp. USDA 4529]